MTFHSTQKLGLYLVLLLSLSCLDLPARAQDPTNAPASGGLLPPTNLRTNIYLPNIPAIAATHHKIQDLTFQIRLQHPGFTATNLTFSGDYVDCGPTIGGTVFDESQKYTFKTSPTQLDPGTASIAVFALQGNVGIRGWIRNDLKPFEIWVAINGKGDSHELVDVREPKYTVGEYLWTIAYQDRTSPNLKLEQKIRDEIGKTLKRELTPEDHVIIYGFEAKTQDLTLYAQPGAKN